MAIEITEIVYPEDRSQWRAWLTKHHKDKKEIWVKLYRRTSDKPSLPYMDLVEECLCFGWIDGVVKKLDAESRVQRITPRRKKSFLSELNRQRIWKLQQQGLIHPGALKVIEDQIGSPEDPLEIPDWIEAALKEEENVWETFNDFPHLYKRLKVAWIKEAGKSKSKLPEALKRLAYLIKMTQKGKTYGTQPMLDLEE